MAPTPSPDLGFHPLAPWRPNDYTRRRLSEAEVLTLIKTSWREAWAGRSFDGVARELRELNYELYLSPHP
jgi:hypothetical protein